MFGPKHLGYVPWAGIRRQRLRASENRDLVLCFQAQILISKRVALLTCLERCLHFLKALRETEIKTLGKQILRKGVYHENEDECKSWQHMLGHLIGVARSRLGSSTTNPTKKGMVP
jgi:hypothetical protein